MDTKDYLQAIVCRCAVLVIYYDHPDRCHLARTEMSDEMRWLSADARRWGVSGEDVAWGLLAELRRKCDAATALRLHHEFLADFASLLAPSPPADPT